MPVFAVDSENRDRLLNRTADAANRPYFQNLHGNGKFNRYPGPEKPDDVFVDNQNSVISRLENQMMSMRLMWKSVAVTLAIALTATSITEAQEQNRQQGRQRGGSSRFGGRGRTTNKLSLVAIEAVQKEIKITEEQKASIKELTDLYRNEQREVFRSFRDLSEEERTKKLEEFQKSTEETIGLLDEVLEEGQTKRLDQIILQSRGIRALRDEKITKKLGVSKEQLAKLKSTFDAEEAKQRKRGEEGRKQFTALRELPEDERRKKFAELREQFTKQREEAEKERKKFDTGVLALLTDEQKKKFESMKGAKFDIPRRSFGRGRGGQRGRRPGEGGNNNRRPQRPSSDSSKTSES